MNRAAGIACFALVLDAALVRGADLVEIRSIDTSIKIELRYATERNIAGVPLYPKDFKAMAERSTVKRLRDAQLYLRRKGLGLKIWDAYRTPEAQAILWKLHPNPDFVAHPSESGGSIHTWGAAIDATLIDFNTGVELRMPTDFDNFGPDAAMRYMGKDPEIRKNLRVLQTAMSRAGFMGIRTEWWHFVDKDWSKFRPEKEIKPLVVPPLQAVPSASPPPTPPAATHSPTPTQRTMRPPAAAMAP